MSLTFATTPFGGRLMTPEQILLNQQLLNARIQTTDSNKTVSNQFSSFDKWKILDALTRARAFFGLSDRTLTVLSALLSVLPGRDLTLECAQIVFPSNDELSRRSHGITGSTLRRHIAKLVETGLIIRRDSPNGKRYAQRGTAGSIEVAYGFDLGPLTLRGSEILAQEEAFEAQERLKRRVRDEISVHLRDMVKMIEAALLEPGFENSHSLWNSYLDQLAPLGKRLPRTVTLEQLTIHCQQLRALRINVDTLWLNSFSNQDLDKALYNEINANDVQNGQQLEKTNTESYFEKSMEKENNNDEFETVPHLETVIQLCPLINDYAKSQISSWSDFMATANLVRSMLGVSPDAFMRAQTVFGQQQACVIIAILLENSDKIRVPGAYLRGMTKKAINGQFSLSSMLSGLHVKQQRLV
jgi:replication initiation protein RepC